MDRETKINLLREQCATCLKLRLDILNIQGARLAVEMTSAGVGGGSGRQLPIRLTIPYRRTWIMKPGLGDKSFKRGPPLDIILFPVVRRLSRPGASILSGQASRQGRDTYRLGR